jgi:glucose/mannose-6-phosphate isomerase
MMNQLIADFPQQLLDALAIGEKIELRADYSGVQNIVVAGMGGSGIGANFVAAIVQDELNIPFAVSKGYDLPKYVGKNSLVIVSSYSGNTEETVLSMEVAHQRGARIICIASGGKVIDFAKKHGLDFVQLPNNGAPPRACLGYSLVQQLCILQKLGMIDAARIDEVHAAAALLKDEQESIMQKANRMGQLFAGKMPVLYACERMEPVAVRLRQQLNENAKILCLHHVIPEMNHNELVGWREQQLPFLVVFFRSDYDSPRNRVRTNINKEIVSHYSNTIIEAHCKGNSFIEQALYATHIGDWLSWEVAELRKVDSMEVRVIDYLKSQLADVV